MMRQVVVGGLEDWRDQWLITGWTFLTRNMRRSQTVKGDRLWPGIHSCGRHPGFHGVGMWTAGPGRRFKHKQSVNTEGSVVDSSLRHLCFFFFFGERASALFENIHQLDTWVEEFYRNMSSSSSSAASWNFNPQPENFLRVSRCSAGPLCSHVVGTLPLIQRGRVLTLMAENTIFVSLWCKLHHCHFVISFGRENSGA